MANYYKCISMSVLYMTLLRRTRRDIEKSLETSSKDMHKKKAPAHLMGGRVNVSETVAVFSQKGL